MTSSMTLTNARIVTPSAVILGSLHVQDGMIGALSTGPSHLASAIDCQGDYLLPGLVELHTDNLEKHMTPRPKVRWNAAAAVLAHDAQMASAGITTVYDAISCGDVIDGSDRLANLRGMVEGITTAQRRGNLRADHRLHLRCEVSCANILNLFNTFVDNELVGIVSLMDHTPGQRQFLREDKYLDYYMGKYHFTRTEMDLFTERQKANSALYSAPHRLEIAATCRERGLTLASHDDATEAHVAEAVALGTDFAEFPTTMAAAKASQDAGIRTLMGAPNLVLGGSHSGNIATEDLARAGLLDLLSSDYVPISLIHAVFLLARDSIGLDLPKAVAMATSVPSAVAGLKDRGSLSLGKRADLIRVRDEGDVPVVRAVWREGERIA
jgi:alpha-D-ribose 1-methylphosphonate 5-triphosphate diphosphatase